MSQLITFTLFSLVLPFIMGNTLGTLVRVEVLPFWLGLIAAALLGGVSGSIGYKLSETSDV